MIRRRLRARKALRALRSLPAEEFAPVDRAYLRLALEIFSRDDQGRTLFHSEQG